MLNNKQIQERIRYFGKNIGLGSDSAICERCKFENRAVLGQFDRLKNTPRLDTIAKFADGLGVDIIDLIINRTDADREIANLLSTMTEYEKTEVVVYIRMMLKEKNQEQRKVA